MFLFVKDFFARHELDIQSISSICIDGSPAIANKYGFYTLMKRKIPHMQGTHCFLHCHALASKTLLLKLKKVLDIFVKTINWIRGHAINHRLFKSLYEDFGSEHTVLLFHAEAS